MTTSGHNATRQSPPIDEWRAERGTAVRKSSLMYVSILALWLYWAVLFDPRLLKLVLESHGILLKLIVLAFVLCLNLFWLLGSYYLMLGLFALIVALTRPTPVPSLSGFPAVAILYTTMNDFQEKAALSCVRQKYLNFHVFILDDSSEDRCQARIDAFARAHQRTVSVVRRPDRKGYKAGNLNHALRNRVTRFPYFGVVDADTVLPDTFVADLLPYFGLGDEIGFVQSSHRPNPGQRSQFARDLCLGTIPLWAGCYCARSRFGNVIFLQANLCRYDVWEEVGGFPEVVAEDLAFTTRTVQFGYRGYLARHVISHGDFPEDYWQFRRQQEKYIRGALEYCHKEIGPFLRSAGVRWYEKLDILLSCTSVLIPLWFLVFMVSYCLMLPLLPPGQTSAKIGIAGHAMWSLRVLSPGQLLYDIWSWDMFLVTLVSMLAPGLGCLALVCRYRLRALKTFLLSAAPYMSLVAVAGATLASYVYSRRAEFLATGDCSRGNPQGSSLRSIRRAGPCRGRWATTTIEVVLGTILMVICAATLNLQLLALALCTFLGPLLLRARWESGALRPFLYAPFPLVCVALTVLGMTLWTGEARLPLVGTLYLAVK